MKLDAGEQPIERSCAHDEGHAGGDSLVLDRRELHFFSVPPATKCTVGHWQMFSSDTAPPDGYACTSKRRYCTPAYLLAFRGSNFGQFLSGLIVGKSFGRSG
jgi:hypothetical protein